MNAIEIENTEQRRGTFGAVRVRIIFVLRPPRDHQNSNIVDLTLDSPPGSPPRLNNVPPSAGEGQRPPSQVPPETTSQARSLQPNTTDVPAPSRQPYRRRPYSPSRPVVNAYRPSSHHAASAPRSSLDSPNRNTQHTPPLSSSRPPSRIVDGARLPRPSSGASSAASTSRQSSLLPQSSASSSSTPGTSRSSTTAPQAKRPEPPQSFDRDALTKQVRMISKKLRDEGKLAPPPTFVDPETSRAALARLPARNQAELEAGDMDVDMQVDADVEHVPSAVADMDVDMDDQLKAKPAPAFDDEEKRQKPWQVYTEADWGIKPCYFLMYRDHEAFSSRSKLPLQREHRLPRKLPATTKLEGKAKKKKQKSLVNMVKAPLGSIPLD
ncbi:hypothetical protein EIP91_009102 [Steccherinum ochraceum]|uniref:Uncharacterized protein n=1 Tax=Steccherinum ochraceum TaxID=92696 RepID=A0A4R0RTS8_9APHY|nr:hypothetical protein EIP91_009102 [Steccherinum ochraceum]